MPPYSSMASLSSSLARSATASNLPYWKPLHMVGVSCLPYQVLEDQLNMIEVPSGGGDPFLAMSPAMGGAYSGPEVLGELFENGPGWA